MTFPLPFSWPSSLLSPVDKLIHFIFSGFSMFGIFKEAAKWWKMFYFWIEFIIIIVIIVIIITQKAADNQLIFRFADGSNIFASVGSQALSYSNPYRQSTICLWVCHSVVLYRLCICKLMALYRFMLYYTVIKVNPVPQSKLLGIVVAELLQARCPSCHPTNSIKALKNGSVTDMVQMEYRSV